MKALEEKLELEISIPRKLHDEWGPTIKFNIKISPPKVDVNESIKALYVSMDESKKRTAMLGGKIEFLERAFSSDCFHKNDEDLKIIGVSSIDFLLSTIKLDNKGIE